MRDLRSFSLGFSRVAGPRGRSWRSQGGRVLRTWPDLPQTSTATARRVRASPKRLQIRLRSRGVVPPRIPNCAFVASARLRHSLRTEHRVQIALARLNCLTAVRPESPAGKERSGPWARHAAPTSHRTPPLRDRSPRLPAATRTSPTPSVGDDCVSGGPTTSSSPAVTMRAGPLLRHRRIRQARLQPRCSESQAALSVPSGSGGASALGQRIDSRARRGGRGVTMATAMAVVVGTASTSPMAEARVRVISSAMSSVESRSRIGRS